MATMTPREQIEWIESDAREFCMTRRRDRPRLAYLVAPVDITAMTRDVSRDVASCGWFEMLTAAGYVDVRPDPGKPAGLAPFRCYRCPCETLFLDDSSRSGRCVVCQMERVVAEVVEIGAPARRYIPVRTDPMLKPDEFRIETDPTEEFARRALADSVSRDTSAVFDFNSVLDEHYPRDENGRHYIPAPPKVDWSKLTKTRKSEAPREWVKPTTESTFKAQPVEIGRRIEYGMWGPYLVADERPDGFAQSKIDEIKAMLTAPAKGKR